VNGRQLGINVDSKTQTLLSIAIDYSEAQ